MCVCERERHSLRVELKRCPDIHLMDGQVYVRANSWKKLHPPVAICHIEHAACSMQLSTVRIERIKRATSAKESIYVSSLNILCPVGYLFFQHSIDPYRWGWNALRTIYLGVHLTRACWVSNSLAQVASAGGVELICYVSLALRSHETPIDTCDCLQSMILHQLQG